MLFKDKPCMLTLPMALFSSAYFFSQWQHMAAQNQTLLLIWEGKRTSVYMIIYIYPQELVGLKEEQDWQEVNPENSRKGYMWPAIRRVSLSWGNSESLAPGFSFGSPRDWSKNDPLKRHFQLWWNQHRTVLKKMKTSNSLSKLNSSHLCGALSPLTQVPLWRTWTVLKCDKFDK